MNTEYVGITPERSALGLTALSSVSLGSLRPGAGSGPIRLTYNFGCAFHLPDSRGQRLYAAE